ncbi:hypothetical protein Tco_0753719 [Tanacetum coccineum]
MYEWLEEWLLSNRSEGYPLLHGVLDLSSLSRVWKSRTCDPILKDSSGNVMGIHDFFCLPEWIGLEVQEEIHHDMKPTLKRLPFYCIPPAAGNVAIPAPTPEDLADATPNSKSEDDDDACYEILIITPIHSAATILTGGNQSGGSASSVPEGPSNRDSQGKAITDDAVNTPIRSVGRSQAFTGPTPVSRDPMAKAKDEGMEKKKIYISPKTFNHFMPDATSPTSDLVSGLERWFSVLGPKIFLVVMSLAGLQGKLLSVAASASFETWIECGSDFRNKQNEEWVRAMVDIPNEEMVDAASDKSVEDFVQNERGSPYYSNALVVALADTGDAVAAPSETLSHVTYPKPNGFPLGPSFSWSSLRRLPHFPILAQVLLSVGPYFLYDAAAHRRFTSGGEVL